MAGKEWVRQCYRWADLEAYQFRCVGPLSSSPGRPWVVADWMRRQAAPRVWAALQRRNRARQQRLYGRCVSPLYDNVCAQSVPLTFGRPSLTGLSSRAGMGPSSCSSARCLQPAGSNVSRLLSPVARREVSDCSARRLVAVFHSLAFALSCAACTMATQSVDVCTPQPSERARRRPASATQTRPSPRPALTRPRARTQ